MRTLLVSTALIGALMTSPATALAGEPCDPAVRADRQQVFAELADQGVRISGVTGAGGHTEYLRPSDADRFGCDDPSFTGFRVAGHTGAGGVSER
jgi:hypothetical protein